MTVNEVVSTIETSEKWRTNLLIGNSEINFKIKTSADVTVIPKDGRHSCCQSSRIASSGAASD